MSESRRPSRVIRNIILRILIVVLRLFRLAPWQKTITVILPDDDRPCRIPVYFSERFIFDHLVQPIVRTAPVNALVSINLPQLNKPLYMRAHTTDMAAFVQVFQLLDYEFPFPEKPQFIIDGGANVGYAAVFFAHKYPQAKIMAVEPEEANCRVFAKNCAGYPNIELIQAGIWGADGLLRVKDIGLGNWGFVVEEATSDDPQSITAVTIEELFRRSGKQQIDILKLDIEGAEKEVFSTGVGPWLDQVNVLIIELHDHLTPGCSAVFYAATEKYNFQQRQRGENVILVKNRP